MDKQKLLEYAQYGCAQKMNDYRILAEKAGSAIKADTAYTLYQQAQDDCRKINKMIAEKYGECYALPILNSLISFFMLYISPRIAISNNASSDGISLSECPIYS